MMDELLSVVIPVHNEELNLDKCLCSVLSQTYEFLDVLIVENGSTDKSLEVCKEWETKDNRIRVLQLDNANVAYARELGTKKARGKYITFIDADDYIEDNYFMDMMDDAEDCDIVTSGYFNGEAGERYDSLPVGNYQSREEIEFICDNMVFYSKTGGQGITRYIWNKFFKRELAVEVFHSVDKSIRIGEDCDFLYHFILSASSIKVTRNCGYHYVKRYDSTAHTLSKTYLKDLSSLYLSLNKDISIHPRSKSLKVQLEYLIREGILKSTKRMGFSWRAQIVEYVFPFYNVLNDEKVILYGAGQVGKDYYLQLMNNKDIMIVAWVDREYKKYRREGLDVCSPDIVQEITFDKIVISVLFEGDAANIKSELVEKGIETSSILWKTPINLADCTL